MNRIASKLDRLLRAQFTRLLIRHWTKYYPCCIATWRLIEDERPGLISLEETGVNNEGPYLIGRGDAWFLDNVWYDDVLEEVSHQLITKLLNDIQEKYPDPVQQLLERDLPELDAQLVERLADRVLSLADKAIAEGKMPE